VAAAFRWVAPRAHALPPVRGLLRSGSAGLDESVRRSLRARAPNGESSRWRFDLETEKRPLFDCAEKAIAVGEVRVTVVRRSGGPLPGAHRTVLVDELDSVLPEADVVIVAAAATSETRHLLGTRELAAMKADAALINIARGPLIDTDALVDALNRGHLWGAGLDVTDPEPLPDGHPLWDAPRVVITSHCADTPEMTEPLLAERVALNVAALVSGSGRFVGVVDPALGY